MIVIVFGIVIGCGLLVIFGREPQKYRDPKEIEEEERKAELARTVEETFKKTGMTPEQQLEQAQKQSEEMRAAMRQRREEFLSRFDPATRKTVEEYFTNKAKEIKEKQEKGELDDTQTSTFGQKVGLLGVSVGILITVLSYVQYGDTFYVYRMLSDFFLGTKFTQGTGPIRGEL